MRLVAFYLPQFHRIPENDRWWGDGFTEWVNVARARPLFHGHDHPRVPGSLGQYDLTTAAARQEQSAVARTYGIDAFCIYFYWFDGMRLLEQPLDAWREDPDLLPYCLSWANEAWSRRWDGRNHDVLMPQSYPQDYVERIFDHMLPHFEAPHYVTVAGKPVLVVHRADLIPDQRAFSDGIRQRAADAGLPGVYLVASETKPDIDPRTWGFDAVAEFPPVSVSRFGNAFRKPLKDVDRKFRGRLLSYPHVARHYLSRPRASFVRHRGVMPSWDNTARRGHKATVYIGQSPARYRKWLSAALAAEETDRGDAGLVFVNAWNEWAEGAYLEPDQTHGLAYLEATREALAGLDHDGDHAGDPPIGRTWSYGELRSLARLGAGSVLARARIVRSRFQARRSRPR